jgi:hypothetical protein
VVAGGSVTVVDGDITITGTGGTASGVESAGALICNNGVVRSTGAGAGAGNIAITGIAGVSPGGGDYGVWMHDNAEVTAAGPGTITMTGTGGPVSVTDIRVETGANVFGGVAAGDVTLTANTINLANLTVTSAEDIILKPRTAATTIGISGGAGTLQITDTVIGFMNPGDTLMIGDSAAGVGAVDISAWDISGETFNVGVYGGTVDFTGAFTYNGANDLTFHSRTGNLAWDQALTKSAGGAASLLMKAAGDITMTQNFAPAAGAVDLTLWADADNNSAGGITLTNAAITSNGGNVILGGGTDPTTDEAVGTSTNGVALNNGDIASGAGNIAIRGRGEAAGTDNVGAFIYNGSVLQSTTGNIAITGFGGNGTDANDGIELATAGTQITSADGDITLAGTGGGTGNDNDGIEASGALVSSTGTGAGAGNIVMTGTAASGATGNSGFDLWGSFTVSTVDGDITLTGAGAGSTTDNYGVQLANGTVIESTGTGASAGNITLDGTGGNGTGNNYGIYLVDAGSEITTVDGDIDITGVGGDGSGDVNMGIELEDGVISSTGTGADAGNITLDGTGGNGARYNYGLQLTSNVIVTTVDGDIDITGLGGKGIYLSRDS